MAFSKEHIQDLVSFISGITNKVFDGHYVIIEKTLEQALYDDLVKLADHGTTMYLMYDNNDIGGPANLNRKLDRGLHGIVQARIELPRTKHIFYTDTLDSVLQYQNFAWEKPDVLILDALLYNGISDSNMPDLVKAYHLAIDLILLLSKPEAGNHSNKEHGGFYLYILGPNKKLQVDIKYTASALDFNALNNALLILNNILNERAYKETKYALLRSALIDLLLPVPQEERFSFLLKHITEAATQFQQNYELFLSEFKFENEREKIETAKREYILSINKVFDDIQNKILAIPRMFKILCQQTVS